MWKRNWEETKQHFTDWWKQDGLVVGSWGGHRYEGGTHALVDEPPAADSVQDAYCNAPMRAQRNHWDLAHRLFPCDALPLSGTDLGPGSLALCLGCEPSFSRQTVWFEPCIQDVSEPESLPPFQFDPANRWWRVHEETLKACAQLAGDHYMVACPDLVENIDILAAMREPQTLLMDMIERPEWVEQKMVEINQVWFDVYQRIYDIISLDDGSAAFGAFSIWGPGKTAKVQCDASAMFSPEMFRRFVVPTLDEQCRWLDYSIYHLDGTQALCHLDALLEIDALDAIEWTPQTGIEAGADPRWYDLYRRILKAGKSVQIMSVGVDNMLPLLDAIGGQGVYLMTGFSNAAHAEEIMIKAQPYR